MPGLCAEFPSLSWLAAAPEGAWEGIRTAVADGVADMQANQEAMPEPLATRKYRDRLMVRIPPEVHRRLAVEAAEVGISRNRLTSVRFSR